ncbi:hypothetical protein [Rufibacter roseolus]|uniref:hypothetical protein n=1 Tax=Rufibacter roseolus TaxID=2817375 RepID=UPI001B311DA5|nr:hypothetical protein [Rufibacter roseolus]
MNNLKGLISLIVPILTLQSCDPYSHGYICNDTTNEIEMELKFNYDSLGQLSKKEFISLLINDEQVDANAIQIKIDTASMIGYYKVKSNTCALVGHSMSTSPRLKFNYLKVRTNQKTISYPDIDKQVNKFFKEEIGFSIGMGGKYYLRIKED